MRVRMEIASFCGSCENYYCLGKPTEKDTHADSKKTDETTATSESSRKIKDYQCNDIIYPI